MRRDEEIERLLEDWLEEEAQPMPRNVLEGAMESISRTTQVSGRRRGPGWLPNRRMGMPLAAAALLVLIIVTGGLALHRFGFLLLDRSGEAPPRLWDPVADWHSAPNQENPSRDSYGNPGVWSYMHTTTSGHDPTSYLLMPNFVGEDGLNQPGTGGTPSFLDEAWTEPAQINAFVGLGAPEGADPAIYLQPGAYAILAWTSPVAGEVTIDGVVARPQDPCSGPSGDLRFSVDRGSRILHLIGLDNGQRSEFNLSTTIGVGDTLYFVVDADGDAVCDLTSLQLTITLN